MRRGEDSTAPFWRERGCCEEREEGGMGKKKGKVRGRKKGKRREKKKKKHKKKKNYKNRVSMILFLLNFSFRLHLQTKTPSIYSHSLYFLFP
jgi:hypothetical protein